MIDRDRFSKCRTMWERGATAGEREAGKSAAARVAASAGLTLDEAVRLVGSHPQASSRTQGPSAYRPSSSQAWHPAPVKTKPKAKPQPFTVAEMLKAKEAEVERRKRATAREDELMRAFFERQEKDMAAAREAQAIRDREWAERRRQHAGANHV
ncbi:hypothetical protein [Methylobacterium soli]|uniref:Uncharacterized protein n=1 Tax=Methylobacterium soli TaxID=553447 RepID=A0A6L3SUW2_9HYPH|nr:hypothetical protein [Methylobacterium soli]KAB1075913.1 hypothetical protein F6X53_24080 [Methylobacterium soli]